MKQPVWQATRLHRRRGRPGTVFATLRYAGPLTSAPLPPTALTESDAMKDEPIYNTTQPFIKLVQSNMELVNQMMPKPEALSHSMATGDKLFHQPQGLTSSFAQGAAFGQMMQSMIRNYAVFLTEWGQCSMNAIAHCQQAFQHSAQQAADMATEATRSAEKIRAKAA